jgi:hypothetical protein
LKAVTGAPRVGARCRARDVPKLVPGQRAALADKVAIREKDLGIWQAYVGAVFQQARLIALPAWLSLSSRAAIESRSSATTGPSSTGR